MKMDKQAFWNLVNSCLAGGLVLLGNFMGAGEITLRGFVTALGAGLLVTLTQFKNYWDSEKEDYYLKNKKGCVLFKFV